MLPSLATARLNLYPASPADLDALCRLLADPAVRRYLCDDEALSRAQVAALLGDSLALGPDGLGLWMLATRGDGARIGCVGLRPVSAAAVAAFPAFAGRVGPVVALLPAKWSRGYAAEALATAAAHALGTLGLARLVALVDEPNAASHRLVRRAGLRPVGTASERRHPLRA